MLAKLDLLGFSGSIVLGNAAQVSITGTDFRGTY